MNKLGFIGAMNRDLVARISGADFIQEMGLHALPLVETSVGDDVAARGARALAERGAKSYLGGSAFNVARLVGLLNQIGPRVAGHFIGVAGAVDGSHPHVEALRGWQIDVSSVQSLNVPPATCVALVEDIGRTLLTALGANASVRSYLETNRDAIISVLVDCDLVHVTSFLDAEVPDLLADIVAEAKAIEPRLKLSLDPGAAWVFPGGAGFEKLLAQTDILHLNHEELAHLTGDGLRKIGEVGQRLSPAGWMIVSRHHDWVDLYEGQGSVVGTHLALPPVSVPVDVVDANGAGDTFCGAFIWALLNNCPPHTAAQFAFNCARAKVSLSGPVSLEVLAQQALAFEFGPAS